MPPPFGWPVVLSTNALRETLNDVAVDAQMPPPVWSAELLRKVVSLIVTLTRGESAERPPPNSDALSMIRLRVIERSPAEKRIAPPVEPVWLFQMPEASIERFAFATKIAPPRVFAMLLSRMQPTTATWSPFAQMAPPSSDAWPFASVMPENVAVIASPPEPCTL